jgi:hypothetical protein
VPLHNRNARLISTTLDSTKTCVEKQGVLIIQQPSRTVGSKVQRERVKKASRREGVERIQRKRSLLDIISHMDSVSYLYQTLSLLHTVIYSECLFQYPPSITT